MRSGIDKLLEFRIRCAQLSLGAASCGNIAEHEYGADDLSLLVAERGSAVINRNLFAGFRNQICVVGQPDGTALCERFQERILDRCPRCLVNDTKEADKRLADGFRLRPSRKALSYRVD